MRTRSVFSVTLAAWCAACAADPASPTAQPGPSTVSFSFSGAQQGAYEAQGTPQRVDEGALVSTAYGTAVTYPNEASRQGTVSLLANDKRGRNYGNLFLLGGVPARLGVTPFQASRGRAFYIGPVWTAGFFRADTIYVLDAGEITVTSVSPTRIRGTFRATAQEFVASALMPPGVTPVPPPRTLMISNGRFDVAIDDTSATYFRCRLFSCPAPNASAGTVLATVPGDGWRGVASRWELPPNRTLHLPDLLVSGTPARAVVGYQGSGPGGRPLVSPVRK